MEEEITEPESSLDEKEEESDEQKEEEWSHPCLPSNESNSFTLTLYECDDPMDSFEISLFDEVDAFYTCGHDVSGPGVCVCNSSHNAIIWRAESRTHLSRQTRPSTKYSRKVSNVRGIPSRPDDQLRWVLIVRSQV